MSVINYILRTRFSDKYRRKKRAVRIKHNFKCAVCGQRDLHIPVHHKIPLRDMKILFGLDTIEKIKTCKLLWDTNWQVPLCHKCDGKIDDNPKNNKSFTSTQEYIFPIKRINDLQIM